MKDYMKEKLYEDFRWEKANALSLYMAKTLHEIRKYSPERETIKVYGHYLYKRNEERDGWYVLGFTSLMSLVREGLYRTYDSLLDPNPATKRQARKREEILETLNDIAADYGGWVEVDKEEPDRILYFRYFDL